MDSLAGHGRLAPTLDGAAPAPASRMRAPGGPLAAGGELALQLAAATEIRELVQIIQQQAAALLGLDQDQVRLMLDGAPLSAEALGVSVSGAVQRALATGKPQAWHERGGGKVLGRRAGLALPLLGGEAAVGALLYETAALPALTNEDRAALRDLGALAGAALEAALQRRSADEQNWMARALLGVAGQLLRAATPAAVAEIAVTSLLAVAGCRRALVFGRDAAELSYQPLAVGGLTVAEAAAFQAARLRVGSTPVLDRVWSTLECHSVPAAEVPLALPHRLARRWRPADLLAAPLTVDGRPAGLLVVEPPAEGTPEQPSWGLLVQGIAGQTAAALDRAQRYAELEALALTDPLTGAGNRRALLADLAAECARRGHGVQLLAVVMLDVDHFKAYNDRHGHLAGDRALRRLVQTLRSGLRSGDRVYRYGGEEFTLVLRVRQPAQGILIAGRMRQQIQRAFTAAGAGAPGLTVSCGVALAPQHGAAAAELLAHADAALYQAKERGRNQVVAAPLDCAG